MLEQNLVRAHGVAVSNKALRNVTVHAEAGNFGNSMVAHRAKQFERGKNSTFSKQD